jgi:hypothetical protein
VKLLVVLIAVVLAGCSTGALNNVSSEETNIISTTSSQSFVDTSPNLTLNIVSVTSPVNAGAIATLRVITSPEALCEIAVYYKSGLSSAAGLEPKKADAFGNVSWSWKVGTRTTPGNWRIVVISSSGGKTVSQETYFTVR